MTSFNTYACAACGQGVRASSAEYGRTVICDACQYANVFWSDSLPLSSSATGKGRGIKGESPESATLAGSAGDLNVTGQEAESLSEDALEGRVQELEDQLAEARNQLELKRRAERLERELAEARSQLESVSQGAATGQQPQGRTSRIQEPQLADGAGARVPATLPASGKASGGQAPQVSTAQNVTGGVMACLGLVASVVLFAVFEASWRSCTAEGASIETVSPDRVDTGRGTGGGVGGRESDLFVSETHGLRIRKPSGWRFVPALEIEAGRQRVSHSETTLDDLLARAPLPLVSMSRNSGGNPELSPTVQVGVLPKRPIAPLRLLENLAPELARQCTEFVLLEGPSPISLGGSRGAYIRFSHLLSFETGQSRSIESRSVYLETTNNTIVIGLSKAFGEDDRCDRDFDFILDSLRLHR